MNYWNRQTRILGRVYLSALLLIGVASPAAADKVTLDPGSWGKEEGKACIDCHRKSSAGLVSQWEQSAHATAKVNCFDCHQADAADDDAIEHEGSVIATIVSPKDCARCHETEFRQHEGSVHVATLARIARQLPTLGENLGGKAVIAAGCAGCHGSRVEVRGDGTLSPDSWPNTGIGRINPDGSKGSCSACHGRHGFTKAQAREPSACTRCHSGPDSPDRAVYAASKHGMMFEAYHDQMNMENDQWVAGKDYSAAPTCVTCHMGAAPGLKSTHDVGLRNAWNLNSPVSEKQYLVIFQDGDKRNLPESHPLPKRGSELEKPDGSMGKVKTVVGPKRRRQVMSKVCLECHGKGFANSFLGRFDNLVKLYNLKFGEPAAAIMQALYEKKSLTPAPFDEPIEFTYRELWHDAGIRARHGAAMASPNDTSWEGMNRVGQIFYSRFLPQVREVAGAAEAKALIEQHVTSQEAHGWLIQPERAEPIPDHGMEKSDHD